MSEHWRSSYDAWKTDSPAMGSADGQPDPWKCLDCHAAGRGYVKRSKHWYETGQGHRIVWANDPRAKGAPRESVDPKPADSTMVGDGEGRR